jgi:HupE / UreJ protein
MKKLSILIVAIVLSLPLSVFAHRLDEYLEATILSIDTDHVDGSMRLVPGVAVASAVIASIDANSDGAFSDQERIAYAQRVLNDVFLAVDGQHLTTHLKSADFPSLEEIKQGVGEIRLEFSAAFPAGGVNHHLVFENHHQPSAAVFLVNTLVPSDKDIQIAAQSRNENQSVYQLDFAETESGVSQQTSSPSFSGFAAAFRLGIHHIAEGTDHLLFLLVLLLPAPLLTFAARWSRRNSIRATLLHILGIVTAFTLGHSLTLALSVFGIVTLPSRPVEVLIAASILISAIHALRPLFPGREAAIAAFFGLIHGLAFASALNALGFSGWYRLVSCLGFNLGIESIQLAVVATFLPSLLLLSRTQAYSALRIVGALLASAASVCWIAERLFNIKTAIDPAVESIAHHGAQLAIALFALSLACWFRSDVSELRHITSASGL